MRNRIAAVVVSVVAMLASVAALSGCASRAGSNPSAAADGKTTASSSPSPGKSSAPAPVMGGGGAPNIPVVRLGTAFAPKTLQLGAGQRFLVIVSGSDKATGSGISGPCRPAAAARFSSDLLSLSCQGSSYLYTTRHAGSGELSVTVRPNCAAGSVCPQWMAAATLKLTIS